MREPIPVLPAAGPFHEEADALVSSSTSKHHVVRTLVDAHADFIWRALRRLGVPHPSVDDATQQVFSVAAGKWRDIEVGRERAYLFGIAMNVAAHARRSAARRRETLTGEPLEMLDPAPNAEELLDRRRARALLDCVLDALHDDLRAVFVLFEIEEMTMIEISDLMGIPPGTVASRVRRGREEFQRIARRLRAQSGRTWWRKP